MKTQIRRFMNSTTFQDETKFVEMTEPKRIFYLVKYSNERERTWAWKWRDVKKLIKKGEWIEFKFIDMKGKKK